MMRFWLLAVLMMPGTAQAISPEWTSEKCARFERAWDMATDGETVDGLTPEFVAANRAFLEAGCAIRGAACPQTPEERELADMLSLMAVAEGATGSFLPVRCRAD